MRTRVETAALVLFFAFMALAVLWVMVGTVMWALGTWGFAEVFTVPLVLYGAANVLGIAYVLMTL